MLGDGDVWNASQFYDNIRVMFGSGSSVQNLDAQGICGQEMDTSQEHRTLGMQECDLKLACIG